MKEKLEASILPSKDLPDGINLLARGFKVSANQDLSDQAARLQRLVAQFRVGGTSRAAQPAAAAKPGAARRETAAPPALGWGGTVPAAKAAAGREPAPEDVIALDDSEFGRF